MDGKGLGYRQKHIFWTLVFRGVLNVIDVYEAWLFSFPQEVEDTTGAVAK
jgi:hypothetical protein